MNGARHLTAIFCDDIRREEGHKLSYIGVYVGALGVQSFPIVLPQFFCALNLRTSPKDVPSELSFRLYRDDDIVAESSVPGDFLRAAATQGSGLGDDRMAQFGTIFHLIPLALSGPCFYRARALCDGQELKGGSLGIFEQKDVQRMLEGGSGVNDATVSWVARGAEDESSPV